MGVIQRVLREGSLKRGPSFPRFPHTLPVASWELTQWRPKQQPRKRQESRSVSLPPPPCFPFCNYAAAASSFLEEIKRLHFFPSSQITQSHYPSLFLPLGGVGIGLFFRLGASVSSSSPFLPCSPLKASREFDRDHHRHSKLHLSLSFPVCNRSIHQQIPCLGASPVFACVAVGTNVAYCVRKWVPLVRMVQSCCVRGISRSPYVLPLIAVKGRGSEGGEEEELMHRNSQRRSQMMINGKCKVGEKSGIVCR